MAGLATIAGIPGVGWAGSLGTAVSIALSAGAVFDAAVEAVNDPSASSVAEFVGTIAQEALGKFVDFASDGATWPLDLAEGVIGIVDEC